MRFRLKRINPSATEEEWVAKEGIEAVAFNWGMIEDPFLRAEIGRERKR
jgi:hypothetical protein